MKTEKMLLTPNKYSRPQIPLKKVTKIAVHYAGNAGSSAKGNRNYFESLKSGVRDSYGNLKYASSHYIIGLEGEVIQCIPENEISYATNDANGYSISIENCHPAADGKFTSATRQSLTELCADICKRYNLNPLVDIIRHYDVTGKKCPLYWVNHPDDFLAFKHEVAAYMTGSVDKVEKADFKVNGKLIRADRILHNGENFIKVKSLQDAGFAIGYDKDSKLVTIDNLIKVLPVICDNEDKGGIESLNLHGYNFVNLRPILAMLGYGVEYNPDTKGVAIYKK